MTISIRTKIIVAHIILVTLVSAFIYTYYPSQQKKLAIQTIHEKIRSISNMFSIGVGIGMGEIDFVAVEEALNWAHSDSAITYISVISGSNNITIAAHNPRKINVPEAVLKGKNESNLLMEQDRMIFYKTSIVYQQQVFGTLIIGYSLRTLDFSIAQLRTTTLYFCLLLFTAGVIVSILIGNMISHNITKLDSAVKAIANGSEDIRVHVNSRDEIGKLGQAFNGMLDKLTVSRKALVDYSNQLKKQNEALDQFSYVVSHDLKAPLRAIFKLSEWLEEDLGPDLPAESKKHLKTLRGRVFRMEAMINGLLEYSKIGRQYMLPETTDTHQVIKDILDIVQPPPSIKISISPAMPVFKTGKISLHQVFSNLILNAIKFNDKPEGRIDLDVQEIGDYYQFTVGDNGMGIETPYHEKVFMIFQTLQSRDKVESTGIGLTIVKKIIEDVGGTICLESDLGEGAKFIFTWPKEFTNKRHDQYN